MSVINSFMCDICLRPATGGGCVTLILEQVPETTYYQIAAKHESLVVPTVVSSDLARHFCHGCVEAVRVDGPEADPATECLHAEHNTCGVGCPGPTEGGPNNG